jgi:hypothetical protein
LASDSQAERKNRERAILEMVYDVDRFDTVRESESPDLGSSDKFSRDSRLDPPFHAFLEDFRKRNTFVTDVSVDVLEDFQT